MNARAIDLNADLGEGAGEDPAVMAQITRANIACGGHAGDVTTMAETLTLARERGVLCGAHPSYPDRANFGRVSITMAADDLAAALDLQITALATAAATAGVAVDHVKAHGALYNDAANDPALAALVARAAAKAGIARLLGPPGSALEAAAGEAGLTFLAEAFVDRAYEADGRLAPRDKPGAVLADPALCAAQALRLAREGRVETLGGGDIAVRADTLCLHADKRGAGAVAAAVHAELEAAGFTVGARVHRA